MISPGSIPEAPGDRVKTDRRDAKRLVRLFAAGELSFSFVPSVEEERFRDLVRCIDDARKDLMRSRHPLSKLLLRRGLRFAGRALTQPHQRWLGKLEFEDALSRAVFVDYCCAIDALVHRRRELIAVLEQAVPTSAHAEAIARLRCFRGINTLTAAGLCAELGNSTGSASRRCCRGSSGSCRASTARARSGCKARSPRPARHTPAGCSSRPRITTAVVRASASSSPPAKPAKIPAWCRSLGARSGGCTLAASASTRSR